MPENTPILILNAYDVPVFAVSAAVELARTQGRALGLSLHDQPYCTVHVSFEGALSAEQRAALEDTLERLGLIASFDESPTTPRATGVATRDK